MDSEDEFPRPEASPPPPAPTMLAPPPLGTGIFAIITLLLAAVNKHVDSQGYAITTYHK